MINYSFKSFYEKKMIQEVGQHIFDKPSIDQRHTQSRYTGEYGNFWFDKNNPLGGETTPIFVTKHNGWGEIEVDFTSEMKGQLATYMTRGVPFYDIRDNSLRYKEEILKTFIKAAGQIIFDARHIGSTGIGGQPRYIKFKPAFDYLRNQGEIKNISGENNFGINLPLTLLEKGLNLAAKEAEKKLNSSYDQTTTDMHPLGKDWDKIVEIECRGSTCKIFSKHIAGGNKHWADLDVWDNSKKMIDQDKSDKLTRLQGRKPNFWQKPKDLDQSKNETH